MKQKLKKILLSILGFLAYFPAQVYNRKTLAKMEKYAANLDRHSQTGIIRGAEPICLEGSGNTACLLIHGFIGSPTDFAGFPELLYKQGYAVYAPLLPGHGTDPRHLDSIHAEQLIEFVKSAYLDLKKKYPRVILIGLSLGASISALVAASEKVDALILASPYYELKYEPHYLLSAEDWHFALARCIPYVYRPAGFKQVFNKKGIEAIKDYDFISMKAVAELLKIGERVSKSAKFLKMPVLMLHSRKDKATAYGAARRAWNEMPSDRKSFLRLEKSNHLIFWDFESEVAGRTILQFIQTL